MSVDKLILRISKASKIQSMKFEECFFLFLFLLTRNVDVIIVVFRSLKERQSRHKKSSGKNSSN